MTKLMVYSLWFMVFTITLLICSAVLAEDSFTYDSRGKRDPFVPLIGVTLQPVDALSDIVSIEDVKFQGVALDSSGRKIALMNGEMIGQGQTIGRVTVRKIGDKRVTLLLDEEEYILNLDQEK